MSPKPVSLPRFETAAKKIELERLARDCYSIYCAESGQFGLSWSELLENHRRGWIEVARLLELSR